MKVARNRTQDELSVWAFGLSFLAGLLAKWVGYGVAVVVVEHTLAWVEVSFDRVVTRVAVQPLRAAEDDQLAAALFHHDLV